MLVCMKSHNSNCELENTKEAIAINEKKKKKSTEVNIVEEEEIKNEEV